MDLGEQVLDELHPSVNLALVQESKVPELDLIKELKIEEETDYRKAGPAGENKQKYDEIIYRKATLGENERDGGDSGKDKEEEKARQAEAGPLAIADKTDTDLVNLRRTIYLTIMSTLDFEGCTHKMLENRFKPNHAIEVCRMILECCSQERAYLRFYGLLGQRLCMLDRAYKEQFELCFVNQYQSIHRLETNRLRNVARFFAHLLHCDGLPWSVLAYVHLNEEETTSSSRNFIKILFHARCVTWPTRPAGYPLVRWPAPTPLLTPPKDGASTGPTETLAPFFPVGSQTWPSMRNSPPPMPGSAKRRR